MAAGCSPPRRSRSGSSPSGGDTRTRSTRTRRDTSGRSDDSSGRWRRGARLSATHALCSHRCWFPLRSYAGHPRSAHRHRRPLSHPRGDRPRRHGHGVPGRGPQARPPGGHQGAAAGPPAGATSRSASCGRSASPPRLAHPQILPLHDSGECDGLLYFVMPYAGCETLRDRLAREGQLPMDAALRITRAVAAALAYAHRARDHPPRHQAGEHPAAGGRAGRRRFRRGHRAAAPRRATASTSPIAGSRSARRRT